MKTFTPEQVDDMIKLRYGSMVDHIDAKSYTSYVAIGKIFGCSNEHVKQLMLKKFEQDKLKQLPLIDQMRRQKEKLDRQRWGYRYLK